MVASVLDSLPPGGTALDKRLEPSVAVLRNRARQRRKLRAQLDAGLRLPAEREAAPPIVLPNADEAAERIAVQASCPGRVGRSGFWSRVLQPRVLLCGGERTRLEDVSGMLGLGGKYDEALGGPSGIGARLGISIHEAGHTVLGLHLARAGVHCDNGWHARFVGPAPLNRYTTVTRHVTEKGLVYAGETKLVVRWRHMHEALVWSSAPPPGPEAAAARGGEPEGARLRCGSLAEADPAAMSALFRIAYLFAGRAAEARMAAEASGEARGEASGDAGGEAGGLQPAAPRAASRVCCGSKRRGSRVGGVREAVQALIGRPAAASSDLRKANLVWHHDVKPRAAPPPAGDSSFEQQPAMEAAYEYADAVLAARWPQILALCGALVVRGTLYGDGIDQLLDQLLCAQSDALAAAATAPALPPTGQGPQPAGPGAGPGAGPELSEDREARRARRLARLAHRPFAFGCVWALDKCTPEYA